MIPREISKKVIPEIQLTSSLLKQIKLPQETGVEKIKRIKIGIKNIPDIFHARKKLSGRKKKIIKVKTKNNELNVTGCPYEKTLEYTHPISSYVHNPTFSGYKFTNPKRKIEIEKQRRTVNFFR